MKKISVLFLIAMFTCVSTNVFASPKDVKGASAAAQEHASDQAIFNRVGDWFATVGKSDEEKAQIKAERKAKRMQKKAQKQAEKANKAMKEKAGSMKDKMNKEAGSMKDKMKKESGSMKDKMDKTMKGSKKGS